MAEVPAPAPDAEEQPGPIGSLVRSLSNLFQGEKQIQTVEVMPTAPKSVEEGPAAAEAVAPVVAPAAAEAVAPVAPEPEPSPDSAIEPPPQDSAKKWLEAAAAPAVEAVTVADSKVPEPIDEPGDDAHEQLAPVSFETLFQFATQSDKYLLYAGMVFEACCGAGFPIMMILFGDSIDAMSSACAGVSVNAEADLAKFAILGGVMVVLRFVSTYCIQLQQKRQIALYKAEYMKAIIRQDIGWYDVNNPQELSTAFGDALNYIDKGFGFSAWGMLAQQVGQGLGGAIIAFIYQPAVAGMSCVFIPFMIYAMTLFVQAQAHGTREVSLAYAEAGGYSSEALTSIRTVAYLGIEPIVIGRYAASLLKAMDAGIRKAVREGSSVAFLLASEPLMQGVGYLFGGWLIYEEQIDGQFVLTSTNPSNGNTTYFCTTQCGEYDARFQVNATQPCATYGFDPFTLTCKTACYVTQYPTMMVGFYEYATEALYYAFVASVGGSTSCGINAGEVLIAVVCINMVGSSLGQIPNALGDITRARQACAPVNVTLHRQPPIDSFSEEGEKPTEVVGEIVVKDVVFAYPAAPTFDICNGYSLHIKAGQQCALSGPSGSGKSTIIGLIERFYDPSVGAIYLDGRDITTLNLKWLRQQLGLEPVLFAGTVRENIQYGKLNEATDDEVIEAAKVADAHTFITTVLSDGYETNVGQGGSRLSGGQKQRIAIARAMVKKPEVLLLDEATSALDSAAERAVQAALDKIREQKKRTTITVAHRLTTIRHSEQIAVVNRGVIIETGTWEELMQIENGVFKELAEKQEHAAAEDAQMMRSASSSGLLGSSRSPRDTATMLAVVAASKLKLNSKRASNTSLGSGDGAEMRRSRNSSVASREAEEFAERARLSGQGELSVAAQLKKLQSSTGSGSPTTNPIHDHAKLAADSVRSSEATKAKLPINVRKRLLELQDDGDMTLYALALLGSLITGGLKPVTALFGVYLISALLLPSPDQLWTDTILWSCVILGVSVVMLLANVMSAYCYGVAGEHLTRNLRLAMMKKLMTNDMGYFDLDENSAGELTMFLADRVSVVSDLAGKMLGDIAKLVFNTIGTFVITYVVGHWKFALVITAMLPLNMLCFMGIMVSLGLVPEPPPKEETEEEKLKAEEEAKAKGERREKTAGQIVGEVVLGIRTLASFNAEQLWYRQYESQVIKKKQAAISAIPMNAIISGFSWGGLQFFFGLQIYIGQKMSEGGQFGSLAPDMTSCSIDMKQFLYVFVPIMVMFGLIQTMGIMAGGMTDAAKAKAAAAELFERIDMETSPRDPSSLSGETMAEVGGIKGDIDVRDVIFAYPTRKTFPICNGYSLRIEAGQVCALCGPSGSGKSTIINLIERFYDPLFGTILIDGCDITTLNLKWFRQQLGLVGQEPVLFQGTVAENIALGKEGDVTQAEIEEAAKSANAHDFILTALGNGYQTDVGLRGGKLSGGQKQRVAIARALVRKPSIMLLDEATSALDNTSEKIVQAALDEMMAKQKKTTITIAHRLSTIRGADVIAVVNRGKIAEKGNHASLMKQRGIYFGLVKNQSGS